MREAVGGAGLLYMVIPIIILLIFFIGFIMNYASAYRAANYAITQIENCQGRMNDCGDVNMETITSHIRSKFKYITEGKKDIETCYISNGDSNYIFRVDLPVKFNVPILGDATWMHVVAETKTMVNVPLSSLAEFSPC